MAVIKGGIFHPHHGSLLDGEGIDCFLGARMAKIGIIPGKPFDPSKLDPAAVKDVPEMAVKRMAAAWESC